MIYSRQFILMVLFTGTVFSQWEPIESGSNDHFRTIFATDAQTLYLGGLSASSNTGVLYVTSDGGKLLNQLTIPDGPRIVDIHFISATTGMATRFGNEMIRTEDGGQSWETISFADNLILDDMSFVDDQIGYLVANDFNWPDGLYGAVYQTSDAGVTWEEIFVSDEHEHMFTVGFADAAVGFAMGGCEASGTFALLKTSDAGESWSNVAAAGLGIYFSSSAFPGTSVGYAGGHTDGYSGRIIKTTNSGTNWDQLSLPLSGQFRVPALSFTHADTGWAVVHDDPYYGGGATQILHTVDGGAFWQAEYENTESSFLRDIWTASQSVGYAAGDNGLLLRKMGLPLNVNPLGIDFGEEELGGKFTEHVKLTNTGDQDLLINSYTIEGPDSDNFWVDGDLQTLEPGQSGWLTVTWLPDAPETDQATLRISTTIGDVLVSLVGSAIEPLDISDAPKLPVSTHLLGNYPNPFNPLTVIRYQLSVPSNVWLRIYDSSGKHIKTLVDGQRQNANAYEAEWDATDSGGNRVASGIYFYQLATTGGTIASKKMILLR